MPRTKGRRIRRRGGLHTSRPIAPRVPQSGRAGGRRKYVDVSFEHCGEYYDDVLVSLRYEKHAVAVIKDLPSCARRWDQAFKVWRVHPDYAGALAARLRDLGYTVVESGARRRSGRRGVLGCRPRAEKSQFESTCACCRKAIRKGGPVHWIDGVMLHAHCRRPDPRLGLQIKRPPRVQPCADCFLIHQGECW